MSSSTSRCRLCRRRRRKLAWFYSAAPSHAATYTLVAYTYDRISFEAIQINSLGEIKSCDKVSSNAVWLVVQTLTADGGQIEDRGAMKPKPYFRNCVWRGRVAP